MGSLSKSQGDVTQTFIFRVISKCSSIVAWLLAVIIGLIVAQVIMRKLGYNQAWIDDLQWWLYGIFVMAGFVYAISTDSHVRVDILYDKYSSKKKILTDLFGLGWFLLPFLILMLEILMAYGVASFVAREGSDSPNGLHRLYLLKMCLPVLFAMGILATVDRIAVLLRKIGKLSVLGFILAALPAFGLVLWRVFYGAKTLASKSAEVGLPLLDPALTIVAAI